MSLNTDMDARKRLRDTVTFTPASLSFGPIVPRASGRAQATIGVFDSGGSAFDSELWCDASVLNQTFKRPTNVFQSVTLRLSAKPMPHVSPTAARTAAFQSRVSLHTHNRSKAASSSVET